MPVFTKFVDRESKREVAHEAVLEHLKQVLQEHDIPETLLMPWYESINMFGSLTLMRTGGFELLEADLERSIEICSHEGVSAEILRKFLVRDYIFSATRV